MKKFSPSSSGFFNPRIFFAFAFCSLGAMLALFGFAATTPPSDTLSTSHRSITYTDTVGSPPNLTGFALGNPNCGPNNALCSVFALTIDPSVGTAAAGYDPTKYQITIQWSWSPSAVDNDIFIKNSAGSLVAKNQSTADPSTIVLPTNIAPGVYQLILVLSTGAPVPYTATVNLEPVAAGPGNCNPQVSDCTAPRFQNYPAGPGQSDDAGEPSLGVDWNPNVMSLQHDKVNTGGVAFFTSSNHEWRINFDDCSSPAIYNWEDVSSIFDQQFVLTDPIGFVDHTSDLELGLSYPPPHTPGRVFAMDLIGGEGQSFSAFSDDDGGSYLPGGNGGPGQGPDHETLGGGPYSGTPPSTASYPASGAKHAIYYCSQDIVAEAQCSRSDDGGQTFGPGVPMYNPTVCAGGIHGHVKVARDGTVYVPNSSCGTVGTAGVAVSTDNGLTWTERNVPNSTSSQDPSVGIGVNNVGKPANQTTPTIYLGYVDGDNKAKIAFSHDRGANWSLPVDVGAPLGVTHAVFPVVVAGDDNRASFGFLGTGDGVASSGTCDPYGATLNCKNIWHLYIATTYDGGQNWITVDATPNDPVQTGTVCLQGTTCMAGRNLLDFNDVTVDSQGRVLLGYADGCVNCSNTFMGQSGESHGTVTRQSGGRRLFAAFDPQEPSVPAPPQMVSAELQPSGGALITWLEPDNGGSPITGYKVYRGTSSGGETFLANVSGETTTKYLDPAPPAGAVYYYATAVNGVAGESGHCREVSLGGSSGGGNSCTYPYVQVDGAGSPGNLPLDPTTPTGGQLTIQRVNIGEPFTDCTDNSITMLMKVGNLDPTSTGNAVLSENSEWQILFNVIGTDNQSHAVYVELDTFAPNSQALPGISIGRRDPCSAGCGTLDSSADTTHITATYTPDGTITFKIDASGPISFPAPGAPGTGAAFTWDPHTAGSQLNSITGNTFFFVGAGAGFLETVQTTGGGTYTRQGNSKCFVGTPHAALAATPHSGAAPLGVTFDASTSTPGVSCVPIASYTLNFGDQNVPPTTQNAPNSSFMHTYNTAGEYTARLTVTDVNGNVSTNATQVSIDVTGGTPEVAGAVSRKNHGAAGTFDIPLPLTGSHGLECRTGPTAGAHNVVVAFQNNLSSVASLSATATTTGGMTTLPTPTGGIVNDAQGQPRFYSVNLTGVPDGSRVSLTLHGVSDAAGSTGDVTIPMDVLLGDINTSGRTDNGDAIVVRNGSGVVPTNTATARADINCSGRIDNGDAIIVRNRSGQVALP